MNRYGLPEQVIYCSKCVISNQRPNSVVELKNRAQDLKPTIEFDENNICSACQFTERKNTQIDWELREKELESLCAKFRRNDGSFDCIVPGSGGKDSRYVAHILKYQYKMNPLTITWAPHDYTEVGWENFTSWLQDGFSNFLASPNRSLHRYLTREAFLNLGHPFQPFIIGQRIIGPKFAQLLNIDLVFYGENQAEYGNNILENDVPKMQQDFFASQLDPKEQLIAGSSIEQHIKKTDFRLSDFNFYLPVDNLRESLECHYFGYYKYWDPQEIYYYAVENTGFVPAEDRTDGSYSKYSSLDDKIDTIHYYTTLMKFGIGRATYDAAQEVRNNKITREEGIELIKKYDLEFPITYYDSILKYLDLSDDEFRSTCDKFRAEHIWEKYNDEWFLRNPIWAQNS
jgi:N-acetyl sugar amidotransferase